MLRVRFMEGNFHDKVSIIITDEEEGRRLVAKPLEFEDKSDTMVEQPTIELPRILFDSHRYLEFFKDWLTIAEMLNFSLENNKQLEAIKCHLEDMRKLVFKIKDK